MELPEVKVVFDGEADQERISFESVVPQVERVAVESKLRVPVGRTVTESVPEMDTCGVGCPSILTTVLDTDDSVPTKSLPVTITVYTTPGVIPAVASNNPRPELVTVALAATGEGLIAHEKVTERPPPPEITIAGYLASLSTQHSRKHPTWRWPLWLSN